MTERYIHHSNTPLKKIDAVSQSKSDSFYCHEIGKPQGLWFSVVIDGVDEWLQFCRTNYRTFSGSKHQTEIEFRKNAKILRISTAKGIDSFTKKYAMEPKNFGRLIRHYIDWASVAKEYDGIIIAPYIWQRRMLGPASWYYTWDVASGCVWRARAVKALKPVKKPRKKVLTSRSASETMEHG